ncbi:hypothetical protein ACFY36_01705 [Actinoplanes sp. NPDC000266]
MAASQIVPSVLEQRLIDAVEQGIVLDLAGDDPVDETVMQSWDSPDRTIRAEVIRDIVLGRFAAEPDPRGLRLRGVLVAGRIDLQNVTRDFRVELVECFLPGGLLLRDTCLPTLVLSGSWIAPPPGSSSPAIDALRLTAKAMVLAWVRVTSVSDRGSIDLSGANLGLLTCTGARLENTVGPALHADLLRVDQGMVLRDGFTAIGTSNDSTIQLRGAHLGHLDCSGAWLENAAGPALHADGLQVDQDLFLRGGFTAIGTSDLGTVQLRGARLGLLDCSGARLENTAGAALVADLLQVDRSVFLRDGFTATGAGDQGVIQLGGARIGGTLWLDTGNTRSAGPRHETLVDLDGTTYTGMPKPGSLERWLRLLREHTPAYAAQPYQQLAAADRAAGHDHEVRGILMAQRRDQIHRGAITGSDRTWARITGLTLGFGYQPWRALLLLLVVLLISVTAALFAGHHGGLAHTGRTATDGTACSALELIGVGLDLGTPLLKTGARDQCAPTPTTVGRALTAAGWLLQALAWAFAALFIAGFTGVVRKT